MIKPRYVETKDLSRGTITAFIEAARSDYYAEHGNFGELVKNMGKAIAYAETAWSLGVMDKWKAWELIQKAEAVIEEVTC